MDELRHPFYWFVLLSGIVIGGFYVFGGIIILYHGSESRESGWTADIDPHRTLVTDVDPTGPAAGILQRGDQIIAVNGDPNFLLFNLAGTKTVAIPKENNYVLRILRNSTQHELALTLRLVRNYHNLTRSLASFIAGLVSFLVAYMIGLSRPERRTIQIFTITWFSASLLQLAGSLLPLETTFQTVEYSFGYLIMIVSLSPIEVATAYHFYSRFPSDTEPPRFWLLLRNTIYIVFAAIAIFFTWVRIRMFQGFPSGFLMEHYDLIRTMESIAEGTMLVALIAACAVVYRNYRGTAEPGQRRRIRWVVYATIVGIAPTALFFIAKLASDHGGLPLTTQTLTLLFSLSNVSLIVIPITVGIAVVIHRLFDIQVVIRRGMQYLFARHVLTFLTYAPVVLLIYTLRKHRTEPIAEVLLSNTSYLLLTVAAVLGLRYRKQLLLWLDRRFFREAYDSELILLSLADSVRNLSSISEISRSVSLQIDSALHPRRILILYRVRGTGELSLGYSSGDQAQVVRIPEQSRFVRIAEAENRAHEVEHYRKRDIPQQETEMLKELGIHLVVPMTAPDQRLVGLLLLGEKKSEEPYTAGDRKLLEALASQIAVLCENLLLKERVDHETRVRQEVLNHLVDQNRNVVKECPVCGRCFDQKETYCPDHSVELILALPVERIIDGKYRLDRRIGRGGMGAVYAATDLKLSREVAVKILVGSMFGDRTALLRFEREARASARLSHPNIVIVHDFGDLEGKGAYLVMEYVEGSTLRTELQRQRKIPAVTAADWFDQILEGVKAAHAAGVIHRDLKPENILLAEIGGQLRVKVLDFGLAKLRFPEKIDTTTLTAPGSVLGTISYMAPEQLTGGETDERTDIFATGVMLAEAITGEQPFRAETSSDIALAILQNPFRLEDQPELDTILQKCLAKNPKNRYASIAELQRDLIPALRRMA